MGRRQAHRQGDWRRCPTCRDEFVDVVMERIHTRIQTPIIVVVVTLLVAFAPEIAVRVWTGTL